MEKNKIKALCFGLLLSLSTVISPCTTSYGLGGDVELCIEENETETPFFVYNDENNIWMELFHEKEEENDEE